MNTNLVNVPPRLFPSGTPDLGKINYQMPLAASIVNAGSYGTGTPAQIQVLFADPMQKGFVQSNLDIYCRVAVLNLHTLTRSTNATIAATNGCTVQETFTGSKDLTLKSCILTSATGVLTITADTSANTQTVTIGGQTYTFLTSLVNTANNVLIGGSPTNMAANLALAINGGSGSGTNYGTGTPVNTQVTATAASGVLTITAINGGTAANSIATTTTLSNGTWGASTLAGGLNHIPGIITFTVTDATVETVEVKFGAPSVGDILIDYSQKLALTF